MARRRDNPEGGIASALATPKTLLNVAITPQRRLATQLFELGRIKALSAATGTTVNDIALALIAGAVRRYLLELDGLPQTARSEEHTSELQSLMRISYADFCLKTKRKDTHTK